jgi:hypothetical protein
LDEKWLKYDIATIYADKRVGGLLISFLKEYKAYFNLTSVCASCSGNFKTYYQNYLNITKQENMETKKCDYELLAKYNGIQLGANGQPIRNGEMTNEIAKELLEKHPHGAKLFSVIPVQEIEVVEEAIDLVEKIVVSQPKKKNKRNNKR